ncbi:MAG: site-2 protease family protein [Actinomycetota bacterium]
MNWQNIVFLLIGLWIGAIFHEYMHARIADRLGDHTARNAGRLTLNPIVHIDPIGTLILPIAILVIGRGAWPAFGYAKPVPVNPYLMKKPRRDMMLVALAGPTTNFALAAAVTLVAMAVRLIANVHFGVSSGGRIVTTSGSAALGDLFLLLYMVAIINIFLGVFNLIPVPPLDGSHILEFFLPPHAREVYDSFSRYGFIVFFILIFVFGRYIFAWFEPLYSLMQQAIFGPLTSYLL